MLRVLLPSSLLLVWSCGTPVPKAPPSSAPTASDTAAPLPSDPPPESTDTGDVPVPTDPWPDASAPGGNVLSVVYDGQVLSEGETVRVSTPPAGLAERTGLRFVITNRTDAPLELPPDPADWLVGEAFSWEQPPPSALAPEESANLDLTIVVRDETEAAIRTATLSIPEGPQLLLEAHIPRPLRVVVVGSGHYTAVSDSYGAAFETEVFAEDETTARDVVWGNGRFLRSDREYDDWDAPGVYQYSEDGLTWLDATTSEEFWVSDCTHAWERFYCVRSSSWTSSDDGSVVLHDFTGWGQLLNGVVFVPGDDLEPSEAPSDTGGSGALLSGDRLVAVGRVGRRMLSSDGASWTADVSSSTTSAYLNAVTYADGKVVAVGGTNSLETTVSLDGGETWSESVLCSDRYATFTSVVYGNGIFLATGQSNACDQIWSSTDGATWTGLSRDRIGVLTFANGWFIGVSAPWGAPAALVRSTDGVTWETVHNVPEGVTIQAATVETWSAP